tara:strand:- start:462 stop:1160 length:699 start_codon:yes stop_codon:yes gene_type:complete
MKKIISKSFLLLILIAFLVFLNVEETILKYFLNKRNELLKLIDDHFIISCALYLFLYVFFVSFSIPAGFILTLLSGYFFGFYYGFLISIFSATIGSFIIFNLVKYNFNFFDINFLDKNKIFNYLKIGIKQNTYKYLFLIRFFPLIPFWLANIIPSLFGVKAIPFIITTFFGIMPMSLIISYSGSQLNEITFKNIRDFQIANIKEAWIVFFLPGLLISISLISQYIRKKIKKN